MSNSGIEEANSIALAIDSDGFLAIDSRVANSPAPTKSTDHCHAFSAHNLPDFLCSTIPRQSIVESNPTGPSSPTIFLYDVILLTCVYVLVVLWRRTKAPPSIIPPKIVQPSKTANVLQKADEWSPTCGVVEIHEEKFHLFSCPVLVMTSKPEHIQHAEKRFSAQEARTFSGWNARVTGYRCGDAERNEKSIVFYQIAVKNSRGCMYVQRRYTEFHEIYQTLKLKNNFQTINEFQFPSKENLFQDQRWVINSRLRGFDKFVRLLAALRPLPAIVEDFFYSAVDEADKASLSWPIVGTPMMKMKIHKEVVFCEVVDIEAKRWVVKESEEKVDTPILPIPANYVAWSLKKSDHLQHAEKQVMKRTPSSVSFPLVQMQPEKKVTAIQSLHIILRVQAHVRGWLQRIRYTKLICQQGAVTQILRYDVSVRRLVFANQHKLLGMYKQYVVYPAQALDRNGTLQLSKDFGIMPQLCGRKGINDAIDEVASRNKGFVVGGDVLLSFEQFLKFLLVIAMRHVKDLLFDEAVFKFDGLLKLMDRSEGISKVTNSRYTTFLARFVPFDSNALPDSSVVKNIDVSKVLQARKSSRRSVVSSSPGKALTRRNSASSRSLERIGSRHSIVSEESVCTDLDDASVGTVDLLASARRKVVQRSSSKKALSPRTRSPVSVAPFV